ncbi:MAG TPA: hypothetical protein VK728_01130 [Candidatus Sulfotelmatobacter sp.]|jgi:hypothetical protein|nr:hypothetical protein [Candidatus Sulfotelmatobacter sp.]
MNINCDDRERILLEGSAEEWAALELHANACAVCAGELRAWRQLSAAAGELRDYEESPALWARIENSLRQQQAAPAPRMSSWLSFDFWRHIPHIWQTALVGALIVALAISSGYLYTHRPVSSGNLGNTLLKTAALAEVERTERDYMSAIDKLAAEAGPQMNTDTPLMANYREKLLVLDSAISDLRTQAEENPSNAHLRYQLLAMYQEKQQTLQDVLETKR